jgi:hypothetical protein
MINARVLAASASDQIRLHQRRCGQGVAGCLVEIGDEPGQELQAFVALLILEAHRNPGLRLGQPQSPAPPPSPDSRLARNAPRRRDCSRVFGSVEL